MSTWNHNEGVYERLVQRAEVPARKALLDRILLAEPDAEPATAVSTADTVFDLLVSATMLRGVSRGFEDSDAWCERIAGALFALIGTID
ncbi:tetR family transcriptional regulator [Rhodococcus sp. MTM3W5.2]|nr:tetR family transcriptional regulator [Rhodococcus sp. MTM3W5.2]